MNSKCQKYVSLIEIFPEKEGRFIGIDDPKNLLQSSDIIQKVYKVEKGDLIGQAKKGFPQVLWLLIGAPSYEEVYEKSLAFHQYCKVLVEPVNEA